MDNSPVVIKMPIESKNNEEEMDNAQESKKIQTQIMSLAQLLMIVPKLRKLAQELSKKGDNEGPCNAALVALLLFEELERWMQEHGLDPNKVFIAWVKETIAFGNTSVSNGVAVNHGLKDGQSILLVNCGTSSTKLQLYENKKGTIVAVEESKGKLPVMTNIPCGSYQVTRDAMTPDAAAPLIQSQIQAWKNKYQPVTSYAFVTGKIREEYYKTDDKAKQHMDTAMSIVFGKAVDRVEFMSQETEGANELTATRALYKNISSLFANQLHVVASCGIGGGSTQWQFANALMAAKVGMTQPLDKIQSTLTSAWSKFLQDHESYLLNVLGNLDQYCVFALKSGFAIGFILLMEALSSLTNEKPTNSEQPATNEQPKEPTNEQPKEPTNEQPKEPTNEKPKEPSNEEPKEATSKESKETTTKEPSGPEPKEQSLEQELTDKINAFLPAQEQVPYQIHAFLPASPRTQPPSPISAPMTPLSSPKRNENPENLCFMCGTLLTHENPTCEECGKELAECDQAEEHEGDEGDEGDFFEEPDAMHLENMGKKESMLESEKEANKEN